MIANNDVFGLLKTSVDVHTLGMSTIRMFLEQSGYKVVVSPENIMKAMTGISKINNASEVAKWVKDENINILSFSYRLDPNDGCEYFIRLYNTLKEYKCLSEDGGCVRKITVAALPDTCKLIERELHDKIIYFEGDESAAESLIKYGIPEERFPKSFTQKHEYDLFLNEFAEKFIELEKYKFIQPQDHYGYSDCGKNNDSYLKRLNYCLTKKSLPIIRVHAGPYSHNRLESVALFKSWVKNLADSKLLDVLSIGSSQLTQSHFGENWDGLANGGGVPINSEIEYKEIAECAKPMLVRTYAGTHKVPWMAQMHERTLNISWHALSYWWFCELDGRGDNTVYENLKEHIETIRYIASTGKPLEPNVPHHFSFRGGDDVTYIVSAYLAAKTAKLNGIKHLILQNMLNTPKYTWGIEDVAKGRAMLKMVRQLEDSSFKVSLQTRAGLDYFAPDLDKAKVQLAAVTALMDDIDPFNFNSPEIIHVVSYSEAVRLATPDIIKESIQITLGALKEYRMLKRQGKAYDTLNSEEIKSRTNYLFNEAKTAIKILEDRFPHLYSAEGLCSVYEQGYLPTPYILDEYNKFPKAKALTTTIRNGAVVVVDDRDKILNVEDRFNSL